MFVDLFAESAMFFHGEHGQREQPRDASPLDEVQATNQRLRFEEVDQQTPRKVARQKDAEARAFSPLRREAQEGGEQEQKEDFVELGGMAADAVAEVDSPRQMRGLAVGVICQPCKEAADAANRDTDAERQRKQVAGPSLNSAEALDDFYANPSAQQAAHNGFAAWGDEQGKQVPGSPSVAHGGPLLRKPKEAAAEERANGGRGQYGPTLRLGDNVTLAGTQEAKCRVSRGVSQRLKDRMPRRVRTQGEHGGSIVVSPKC